MSSRLRATAQPYFVNLPSEIRSYGHRHDYSVCRGRPGTLDPSIVSDQPLEGFHEFQ
ncbi:hypothetical protein PAXRUDRAFT_834419 [Paxillus rubicundulus Ve08.2h10]|uniref:Uncharacterized protein n=1 Tax=Paxillus rubicundulus Ve08.2h10 TaxID=930991 RepID=A0A0D0C740_9AGAM|nr:hypothetical protein PAXRUDRAFT_834419 [Paxillus rubicundulus Ve08.2h10]